MNKKPHLLYLEDDKDYASQAKYELQEHYEVTTAPTLAQAKRDLATEIYHIVLVDVSLESYGLDDMGLQFVRYIREQTTLSDIPVVILTSHDTSEIILEAFSELKVSDFLVKKKIDTRTLLIKINDAVKSYWGFTLEDTAKVLVIEDDLDWRESITQILEQEGCQVDSASTYEEAIDKLSTNVYQLATVDIRLSNTNAEDTKGFDWAEITRRLNQQIPVIFISAYSDPARLYKAAFDYKAEDFIDKGDFNPLHLRRRVRDILSRTFYVSASLKSDSKQALKTGEPYILQVFASPKRPHEGIVRSLLRPMTSGRFDLEIVVQPFDVDVLPGTSQFLTVNNDDSSDTLSFDIIPVRLGTVEIVVDVMFQSNMLSRLVLTRDAIADDA